MPKNGHGFTDLRLTKNELEQAKAATQHFERGTTLKKNCSVPFQKIKKKLNKGKMAPATPFRGGAGQDLAGKDYDSVKKGVAGTTGGPIRRR